MQVAVESLRSQVKRLRRFPSVVTFLYSSDQLPPPEVEQAYLDVFHSERWAVGLINSAVRLDASHPCSSLLRLRCRVSND